jgi:predicted enzyme related to lactoylglutathione lyase
MPERNGYIPGIPCALDATEPDPEGAVAFYSGLFGWECEDVMPPESETKYFVARLRGRDVAAVGSIEVAPQTATWNTHFWVDSADGTASKVREAGGSVLMEPFDIEPNARRKAICTDREGAAFCVWQAKSNRGAQLVNEPGTLVFNGLNTRHMGGAKSFYGSVFGWRTLTLDSGAEMWALPGYGDYLERDNPDLREQLAEMGGPGYEDVVASIDPIPDDRPDSPARLECHLRGRRPQRHRVEGHRARRHGDRPAPRSSLVQARLLPGPLDNHPGPPERDVQCEQVRAGEQGTRQLRITAAAPRRGRAAERPRQTALSDHAGRFDIEASGRPPSWDRSRPAERGGRG